MGKTSGKKTAHISKRHPFIEEIRPHQGILRSRRDIYAISVSTDSDPPASSTLTVKVTDVAINAELKFNQLPVRVIFVPEAESKLLE